MCVCLYVLRCEWLMAHSECIKIAIICKLEHRNGILLLDIRPDAFRAGLESTVHMQATFTHPSIIRSVNHTLKYRHITAVICLLIKDKIILFSFWISFSLCCRCMDCASFLFEMNERVFGFSKMDRQINRYACKSHRSTHQSFLSCSLSLYLYLCLCTHLFIAVFRQFYFHIRHSFADITSKII